MGKLESETPPHLRSGLAMVCDAKMAIQRAATVAVAVQAAALGGGRVGHVGVGDGS